MASPKAKLILASASPRRLELLAQIGITPAKVVSPSIDETPFKNELPLVYAERIASAKAIAMVNTHQDALILAADTVVYCGRRILPKAETLDDARYCLSVLSGRRHRVTTAVACAKVGMIKVKLVTTMVRFKRLSETETVAYLASNEWQGKAGGYGIQGQASVFIPSINGSYSNVVGLPLAETATLLSQMGF